MLNGSSDVSGLACTSRDLGLLLWTAKNSPPIFRDAAGRLASPKRYGALTGSAARACRHRARVSIRAWDRYLRVCRARSAGHPAIRIPSRATGSAATAGTVSSCDAVRRAPGSAMSTACRDFTRRGRAPGAGSTTTASARTRTRLPQARPSWPPKCTATGVQAARPHRTPAAGTGHRRTTLAVAVGPASPGAPSPRHGQVPTPTPGIWHFMRKRGVLAGAAVMVAVAGTLAALLGAPDHGGSNKPPLLTKSARPTLRQTSTAAVIACASGSIELIGSSTFGPVVQAAASIYTRQCHASHQRGLR